MIMRPFLYIATFFVSVVIFSCKDGDATSAADAPSPAPVSDVPLSTTNAGVEHYICPNGHAGSGGAAAGSCAECGATLEHNAEFHNTPPPSDQAAQANNLNNDPNGTPQASTNPGVEHYICPNGHIGSGGAAAGTCAECGAELSHNADFHNTPPPADLVAQANNLNNNPNEGTPPPAGVEHYICPNGHVGFGGSGEGACSQCQAVLVHNDAFHSNDAPNTSATAPPVNSGAIIPQPSGAVSPVFQNAGGPGSPSPGAAPQLEPAQNAQGVWHYICEEGHPGGAGSATACSTCGKTLVHNQGYH